MKTNKLIILILVGVMLATFACSITLPDIYTAWAEAEEIAALRAEVAALRVEVDNLAMAYDEHTHDFESADLQEQFDLQVVEWDLLIVAALEVLEGR